MEVDGDLLASGVRGPAEEIMFFIFQPQRLVSFLALHAKLVAVKWQTTERKKIQFVASMQFYVKISFYYFSLRDADMHEIHIQILM